MEKNLFPIVLENNVLVIIFYTCMQFKRMRYKSLQTIDLN